MPDKPRIFVLVLTYSEESDILDVVLSVKKVLPDADILVVDVGLRL